MKHADRLKVSSTGTSSLSLAMGAAFAGCRTLATVIADGASNPQAIKVGDTGVPFWVDDSAGNQELGLYTITSSTQIDRTSVLYSSAGGTTPATFTGSTLTVYNAAPASWLSLLLSAVFDGSGNLIGFGGPNGKTNLIGSPLGKPINSTSTGRSVNTYTVTKNAYPGRISDYMPRRKRFIGRNPTTNTATMQFGAVDVDNGNRNGPGVWYDVLPGQEIVDNFTPRQWFARAKAVQATALTSSGTVATATLANHGFVVGENLEINGANPGGYGSSGLATGRTVTSVIDANTFTYNVASGLGTVTALPYYSTLSQSVEIETEVAL